MATLIPEIKPIDDSDPQSIGRINVESPDVEKLTSPITQAAGGVMNTAATEEQKRDDLLYKQQVQAWGLKAADLDNQREEQLRQKLVSIGQMPGDTTQAYKDFDDYKSQLDAQTQGQISDLPEQAQTLLKARMTRTDLRVNNTRVTQQTKQYYDWQNDVVNKSISLSQDDAMNNSANMNAADPSTYTPVKNSLDAIIESRTAQAAQNGYHVAIVTDPDTGQQHYQYDPVIMAQIKSDMAGAIVPIVKSLNAAGKVNEAKIIMDEYGPTWLSAKNQQDLANDHTEAGIKTAALAQLSDLGPDATLDDINDVKGISDDVRFKMRELKNTMDSQDEQQKNRQKNDALQAEFQRLSTVQNGDEPYATVAQYQDSPQYKNLLQYASPSNMKALENLIKNPEASDPDAANEMWKAYQSGDLKNWDPEQYQEIYSKLDSHGRSQLDSMYRQATAPATDQKKGVIINQGATLVDRLIGSATDPNDPTTPLFRKGRNGKYSPEDQATINGIKAQIQTQGMSDSNINSSDMQQQAKDLVAQAVADKLKPPPSMWDQVSGAVTKIKNQFSGTAQTSAAQTQSAQVLTNKPTVQPTTPTQTPTPMPSASPSNTTVPDKITGSNMATWDTGSWLNDFKKAHNNQGPTSPAELIAWKKSRIGSQ